MRMQHRETKTENRKKNKRSEEPVGRSHRFFEVPQEKKGKHGAEAISEEITGIGLALGSLNIPSVKFPKHSGVGGLLAPECNDVL